MTHEAIEPASSTELVGIPDQSIIRGHWMDHLDRELSEHTRRAYIHAFDRFTAWIDDRDSDQPIKTLAQITRSDISEYREYLRRRYSLATVKLQLAAIRAFYDWAISLGAPIDNPAAGVKARGRRSPGTHLRDPLSDEEVQRLISTTSSDRIDRDRHLELRHGRRDPIIDLRDRAIMSLMLYCALRTIEIQRAKFGDLEIRQGRQILWVWRKGRSEPDDFVVLPTMAERALHDWIAIHPTRSGPLFCTLGVHQARSMSLRTIRAMVKARLRKAGIRGKRKSTHSLRHTAITNAINHGADPNQVRRMAGHSSIKTTLHYFHETDRIEDPAEDRIRYGFEEESLGHEDKEKDRQ